MADQDSRNNLDELKAELYKSFRLVSRNAGKNGLGWESYAIARKVQTDLAENIIALERLQFEKEQAEQPKRASLPKPQIGR
ncbi:MAG: hypothetical protein OXT65_00675 [Alphaproteobacteria bacterium]|nr:hypothetical protein [Alphaproteobacteria bacterium]